MMWVLAAAFTIAVLCWSAWRDSQQLRVTSFTDDELDRFLQEITA